MKVQQGNKSKKIEKIILLCFANSVFVPMCVMGCYPLGYLALILGITFQLVLVFINYFCIRTMWKMCVMDVASLCCSAAGLFGANYLYEKNISNDSEGKIVFEFFLGCGLIFGIFTILFAVARAYRRDGHRIKESIICGVLGIGISVFLFYFYLLSTPFTYEYASVDYSNTGEIDSNAEYVGEIGYDNVKISTKEGKSVSVVSETELGIEAEQIALGKKYYYLLGDETLVKLDYNSRLIAKRRVGNVVSLTCRNDYLFLGTYADEEEFPVDIVRGFYANQYLKESEFERGKIKRCRADSDGKCVVSGITLYDHKGKYFSTNPYLSGYNEINDYSVTKGTRFEGDKSIWRVLVEDMLRNKGLEGDSYTVDEYQCGDFLYGVVNVKKDFFGVEDKKLKGSIAYRISCHTKRLEVLAELPDKYMILATDTCVICQNESQLVRIELPSGSETELVRVSDTTDNSFMVSGDYISLSDERMGYIYWNYVSE